MRIDAAARAAAISPSGCAIERTPIGARKNGTGDAVPTTSTDASRSALPESIRGLSRRRPTADADVPHCEAVVEPVDAMRDPVEPRDPAGEVRRLDALLHKREDSVHALEVGVLGRAAPQLDTSLLARRHEHDRQVAVD